MSQRELLTFVSAVMALLAIGLDLVLPAFDDIRETYDLGAASPETAQVITVYFFGLAVAQLFYGPLADRFGRKPVLYLGIAIYIVGAAGSALAPTFELLLVSRFVWGVGAAGSRVVATAIIRDRFVGAAMANAMSQVMAVFMLVPVLAPSLGTAIIAVFPWPAVFWFCVVWAVLIALWGLRMRESLNPDDRRPLNIRSTLSGYVEVSRTRVTFGYTMSTVFIQGVFTTYLASSELIISDIFDRETQFPYIFGAVAVLFALAAIINGRIVERVGIHRLVNQVFVVTTALAFTLVIISLASDGHPNFWVFMPILGLTLGSFMFLMPNLNTAALTPVGHLAGTASAWSGAVRMAGGAVLGTFASAAIDDSTTPFAIAVAVFIACSWATVLLVRRRSPMIATEHLTPTPPAPVI